MKKLMVVMMAVASLGVFADQEADTNASTSANQIVTSGGDGDGVRMDALQQRTQAKRSAIVRVETSKVDAFLQAHFGVKFGDPIDGFTNVVQLIGGEARTLPVLKAVGRLNSAIGRFRNGKLRTVHFVAPGVCKEHTAPVPDDLQKSYVCVAKELGIDPSDVKPLGLVFGDAGCFMEWNAPLWDKDCNGIYNLQIEGPLDSVARPSSRRSPYLGSGRRSLVVDWVEPPEEIYEKIPEEYQPTLRSKINDLAGKQSAEEASDKFGVLLTPRSWTNGCDKGMIVSIQGDRYRSSLFLKCDRDGKIVRLGELSEFEEFKWRNARRGEIVTNLWNDQKLVEGLLATAVSNDAQKVESKRQQRELERLQEQLRKMTERLEVESRSNAVETVKKDAVGERKDSLDRPVTNNVARKSGEDVRERKKGRLDAIRMLKPNEEIESHMWEEHASAELKAELNKVDFKTCNANIDSFLKEYLAVEFGEGMSRFPKSVAGLTYAILRDIPMVKKFKHFDHAIGRFAADKLYEVYLYVDVPRKYSKASAENRINQDINDLITSWGLPKELFVNSSIFRPKRSAYIIEKRSGGSWSDVYCEPKESYRLGLLITAKELRDKFWAEERSELEEEENKGQEFQ